MDRFDHDRLDDLVEEFNEQGLKHSPMALPIDTYTGLLEAGFSEHEALELTRLVCANYYIEVRLHRR